MSVESINQVFAMSKHSTVVNDYEEAGQERLNRLNWLEFLEFFCRVAHIKFCQSEMEGLSLSQKLEFVMDEVFPACIGCERQQVGYPELQSEEEEDY